MAVLSGRTFVELIWLAGPSLLLWGIVGWWLVASTRRASDARNANSAEDIDASEVESSDDRRGASVGSPTS